MAGQIRPERIHRRCRGRAGTGTIVKSETFLRVSPTREWLRAEYGGGAPKSTEDRPAIPWEHVAYPNANRLAVDGVVLIDDRARSRR
jgi:hypothetical protein